MEAATILREARTRARLSQTDLARRAGVAQSVISAYESGKRDPSLSTLMRLVAATGGWLVFEVQEARPLGLPDSRLGRRLRQRRRRVLEMCARYGATNVRVFGSVARGEDDEQSDVDLLVDLPEKTGLLKMLGLEEALEGVLGARVQVTPSLGTNEEFRANVLRDAIPL
jgi:hypothetical protein